jgi:hypothetical protein
LHDTRDLVKSSTEIDYSLSPLGCVSAAGDDMSEFMCPDLSNVEPFAREEAYPPIVGIVEADVGVGLGSKSRAFSSGDAASDEHPSNRGRGQKPSISG